MSLQLIKQLPGGDLVGPREVQHALHHGRHPLTDIERQIIAYKATRYDIQRSSVVTLTLILSCGFLLALLYLLVMLSKSVKTFLEPPIRHLETTNS